MILGGNDGNILFVFIFIFLFILGTIGNEHFGDDDIGDIINVPPFLVSLSIGDFILLLFKINI